jgi:hypothetical protein
MPLFNQSRRMPAPARAEHAIATDLARVIVAGVASHLASRGITPCVQVFAGCGKALFR